jgi:transposase
VAKDAVKKYVNGCQVAEEGTAMVGPRSPRLLGEFDLLVFDTVVPPDHYLRRVIQCIDFERFRGLMSTRYSPDQGRPSEDSVVMLKLEFLQYHDNLSDRNVMGRAATDMAYRLFLGLPLTVMLAHPSLLSKFRGRLGSQIHSEIFDDLVAQARQLGLVKDRLRLKDATHIIANVAIPSTLRLLSEVREKLLSAAEPYDPLHSEGERVRADVIRQSDEGLSQEDRLVARVEHLTEILLWSDELPPPSEPDAAWQKLCAARELAHKVLHDRQNKKDRTVSSQEPDARFGKHGKSFCGFKLDISMDPDSKIITSLGVIPANGDEAANATKLIEHEQDVHGNCVGALSIDSIGFDGQRLAEWCDPLGLDLDVFVPPKKEPASDYFVAEDFEEDSNQETVTCPAGEKSYRRNRNEKDTGWMYRFRRATCASCPLLSRCMKQLPQDKGRTVTKNDYQAYYDAARSKAKTEEYQQVRKQHPAVERKLWELMVRHGGRRARSRGQPRVLLQQLMTGVVVNVKRIVRLLESNDAEFA